METKIESILPKSDDAIMKMQKVKASTVFVPLEKSYDRYKYLHRIRIPKMYRLTGYQRDATELNFQTLCARINSLTNIACKTTFAGKF